MVTRLLERTVPLDQVKAEAQSVNLGRLVLLLVVGVFYVLGFAARKAALMLGVVAAVLGVGLGVARSAIMTGWREAALPAEERQRARAA